jgi:hypothetical protein
MAEDLTGYTEVDPNSHISKTSSRVTAADLDQDESAYLYKDFGANYFDGIDLKFAFHEISTSDAAFNIDVGFANTVNSNDAWTSPLDIYINLYSGSISIGLYNGDDYDESIDLNEDTTYYLWLTRAAGSDTATLKIYSDSGFTTLLDTLTLSGFGTTKWRYFYPITSYNNSTSNKNFDGYLEYFVFTSVSICRPRAQIIGMW